jgi:hypothetical protein
MDIETIRLRTTMTTRLTLSEKNKLALIAKQRNLTKSELLRSIAVNYLMKKATNNFLITNKPLQ